MSDTQSVLDAMTAGIVDRKAGRGAKPVGLTPVAGEKVGIPDVPEVFLTNEAVADVAKDLRKQAELLVLVADALDKHTGERQPTPVVDDTKQREREADARVAAQQASTNTFGPNEDPDEDTERFKAQFARKQAEAQASVFGDAPPPARERAVGDGWVCPTHGSDAVSVATSKRGRKYRVCGKCSEFER